MLCSGERFAGMLSCPLRVILSHPLYHVMKHFPSDGSDLISDDNGQPKGTCTVPHFCGVNTKAHCSSSGGPRP